MNDSKSRALLATALHPSSSPNERLMALAAFGRILARAGIHPNDVAIVSHGSGADSAAEAGDAREIARLATGNAALARRIKAQETALRKATRDAADAERRIADLHARISALEEASAADACQIVALENDLAARDRRLAGSRTSGEERV